MYACSTTTYNGFQAVMTEEESEKFRGKIFFVYLMVPQEKIFIILAKFFSKFALVRFAWSCVHIARFLY